MIKSMTAFARKTIQAEWGSASWELRSVNHRYLELSLRLPEGLRELEMELRSSAKKKLHRGKVDAILTLDLNQAQSTEANVNTALVQQLIKACDTINENLQQPRQVSPMELIRWPGVFQIQAMDLTAIQPQIQDLFQQALDELNRVREREGAALVSYFDERLATIKQHSEIAEKLLPDVIEKQRHNILEKLQEISEQVDTDRLEQEMVYFAQKIDVAEELSRLFAHCNEVSRIVSKGSPCGRKLDFLMQELNREANTLSSKSTSSELTNTAVDMKVLIEQMREQVQNIE